MKFWRSNPKLLRKIKRRQAIAPAMPQSKAEARAACDQAAASHPITRLPPALRRNTSADIATPAVRCEAANAQ